MSSYFLILILLNQLKEIKKEKENITDISFIINKSVLAKL